MGLEKVEGLSLYEYGKRPLDHIAGKLLEYGGIWIHSPYHQDLLDWVIDREVALHLLLRDPRDIIVSWAHVVEQAPKLFWNYRYNRKQLTEYNIPTRIDILTKLLVPLMHDFDQWRQRGCFEVHHYRDIIERPEAKDYTFNKVRGVVGSHKDEMTGKQIAKANRLYGDIIDLWSGENVTN